MSFYEHWQVEVVGREIMNFTSFEDALQEFLLLRDYSVQLKLIFTGAEWGEE